MSPVYLISDPVVLSGHKGAIYALERVNDGFISAGSDKVIAFWQPEISTEGVQLAVASGIVYSLLFDADKNWLFAGQSSGGIHVIGLDEKRELRLLKYHEAAVFSIAASHKFDLLLSGDASGILHVSRLSTLEPLAKVKTGSGKVRSIVVDEVNELIYVGTGEGKVICAGLSDFNIRNIIQAHKEQFSVNALCILPEQQLLLTGSRDAHLHIFDLKNNFSLLQSIPAHNYAIYKIIKHPSLPVIATASRDKTVKLWDAATMEIYKRLDNTSGTGHTASVNTVIWNKRNQLVSAGDDRMVLTWDVAAGNQ